MPPNLWYPQRYNFEWELGGYCTHEGFYMHQVPLMYMAVLNQVILEPGPSGLELSALLTGLLRSISVFSTSFIAESV